MAEAHAATFDSPWSAHEIASLLAGPGGYGFVVEAHGSLAGFILCRVIVDESEVLTLATVPDLRRRGVARAMVEAAMHAAAAGGAQALFLEVAADNLAAIALYAQAGFVQVGVRAGYYAHESAAPVDALVLRRAL